MSPKLSVLPLYRGRFAMRNKAEAGAPVNPHKTFNDPVVGMRRRSLACIEFGA